MARTWTRLLLVALVASQLVALTASRTAEAAAAFSYRAVASDPVDGTRAPSVSADGRYVVFETEARLHPFDNTWDETLDVYVYDRETDQYRVLSGDLGGELGDTIFSEPSYGAKISGDGRYAIFTSDQPSFTSEPAEGSRVVRVRLDGTMDWDWISPPGSSYDAVADDISHDGSVVVWSTDQPVTELSMEAPPSVDDNGVSDVVLTHIDGEGALEHRLVSWEGDSQETDVGASYRASVSPDGTFVAYVNDGHESLTPDQNDGPDVMVSYADGFNTGWQITGTDDDPDLPGPSSYRSFAPVVLGTSDAPEVVFLSDEPLTGVDPEGVVHAYRWARLPGGSTETQELLTVSSDGIALGGDVHEVAVSPGGRYVTYATSATNVIDGVAATGSGPHVYRLDLEEPQDERQPVLVNQVADGTASAGNHSGVDVADGGTVAFGAPDGLDPQDTNGHHDVLVTGPPAPVDEDAAIASFTLDSSAGDGSVPVGLDTVPIGDIPVGSIPLGNASLAATPIRSIDIAASPIRSIPIRSIPIRSIPLLADLNLSAFPVVGGWAPRLVGTPYEGAPLHTVTLGQVAALPAGPQGDHPFDGLQLHHLDVAATPIRSIGLASIALGATPIRSIPIRSIGDDCTFAEGSPTPQGDTAVEANWQRIVDCLLADFQVTGDTTLAALDIAGVPIRSIPIRSIPIRSIDLAAAPIRSIPIRSIELGATPIRSIPIRSILMSTPIRSIPIRSIPIRSIDSPRSPLHAIPIRSIPQGIVDCSKVDCGSTSQHTLGDAADLGAILEAATLERIEALLDGYTLGDLYEYGDTTIGDLLDAPFPAGADPFEGLTLGDLLIGLLLRGDYPWEELPVADLGLQPVAPTEELVSVTAQAVVTGTPAEDAATLTVELPAGAVYAPGTGEFRRMTSGVATHVPPFVPIEPTASGRQLTFTLPFNGAGQVTTVRFDYHPGVRLEAAELDATYDVVTDSASASAITYDLVQRERSGDPATAPVLRDGNTLVIGHLASAGEVDYFRIPASAVAGKRLRIDLAVPGNDQDLVLYSPIDSVPAQGATLESVPIRSIAVEDGATEVVPPETLQDVPIRSIPIRSISANRGDSDEAIEVLADETDSGYYTIQISGYNGASSVDPYVLRMRVTDPPSPQECTPRVHPNPAAAPTTAQATPAPFGTEALFVVNPSRLDAIHGAGAGDDVTDAIEALLEVDPASGENALGMEGHLLAVDRSQAVRDAYTAWDDEPCSPAAANAVVTAITGLIEDSHLAAAGATTADVDETIPYVVLVGGDDTLPQARVPDLTRIANERSYLPDVAGDQPLAGAAYAETLLSDDPYGDRDPMPWLNRHLYVPDTALGRLVETPDQIVAQLTRYATWDGSLEPTTETGAIRPMTALVTGYDFLSDGAAAVSAALGLNDIAPTDMISDSWTRLDLVEALFGAAGSAVAHTAADVIAINAHFDHHRSLPADQDAAHVEDDLFTTEHVDDADPDSLARRILFSMGCHGGLSVPDVYIEGARDWVESFGDQGAAVYAANTGYGYGDTATVALSERLMASFAEGLDGSMTVGQAMQYAKQHYASQLGLYGAYDEKVMAEATFYGLPMFEVRGATTAPQPSTPDLPTPAAEPDTGGVLAAPFDVEDGDEFDLETVTSGGTEFTQVAGELPQVTHGRPITPRFDLDASAPGKQARGVLITGLTSEEGPTVDATFARPVIDDSAREPAQPADVAFPAYFASVNRHRTPSGAAAKLVLMPGQFVPDEDATTLGRGTHRTFTRMAGYVTYVDESDAAAVADVTPPAILATSATSNATTATFEATVTETDGEVRRVIVLYRDPEATTQVWLPVELSAEAGGTTWQGTVPSGGADQLEYLVQAVDGSGNVGATTNKGYLHRAATDVVPPEVDVVSPTDGGRYLVGEPLTVDYDCSDANLTSCAALLDGVPVTPGAAVDTSTPGTHTLEVRASDSAGNRTVRSVTFSLVYAGFTFTEPLTPGQRTQVKAGSAVPVRWQLFDAAGPVSDRSAITGITSTALACDGGTAGEGDLAPTNEVSGLRYDPETEEWRYVWKTDKKWKGTCRQLTVTLSDGQSITAMFRMT